MDKYNHDFEYDSKDISLLQSTFRTMKEDSKYGFYVGLGTGAITGLIAKGHFNLSRRGASLAAFIGLALGYNGYTHQSQVYYQHIASKCNMNASKAINLRMNPH